MEQTLLLCALAFLAGLVDAVAGGGGLVQVPALFAILPGAAPAVLLGTNKISSIAGTLAAALRYLRAMPLEWRPMLPSTVLAAGAAGLGAWAVSWIPAAILRPAVFLLLLAALSYSLWNRRMGLTGRSITDARPRAQAAYAAGLGFYDGLFGPGAGAFFMFGLVKWFRYDFLEAAARARIVNLASNAGALGVFLAAGNVDWVAGIPMAAANVAGGYLGAATAVKRGAGFVRRIFLLVVAGLIAKFAWDLLS